MKKIFFYFIFFVAVTLFSGLIIGTTFAQTYIHANGGSYWTQYGNGWNSINNDGYCVSGRGPCGSSLWYLKWNYNHSGCGADAYANYPMSSIVNYNGDTYAWIDSTTGNMYGADYNVAYNYASSYTSTVNQSAYYEAWATIALDKYRTAQIQLSDGWGAAYACNGVSGLQVEFDEIKLEL